MVIPVVMLAVLALVAIRALMGVVAREDVVLPMAAPTASPGVWGDDARSLLLPAAGEVDLEQVDDVAKEANAS